MNKITVKKDRGYDNKWNVTIDDGFEAVTKTVNTNENGNGLWVDGTQVEGTAQFSVNGIKNSSAKIRNYFSD